MTTYAPHFAPPAAPHAPQPAVRRAGAMVEDLFQPIPDAPASGVFSTLFMAVPTFGLLPALVWPLRWNAFAAAEREQYERVTEWVRINVRHPDVPRLCGRAAAIRPSRFLLILPLACLVAVVAVFVLAANFGARGGSVPGLLESTYGSSPFRSSPLGAMVFWAWTGLLSVGYFCHWLQVHLHARHVRCFLDEFNKIAIHEALGPVFLPPVGFGLRPLYTLAAVALIPLNALWGVPLMLAGAVQRSYVRSAGQKMRTLLARRVQDLMLVYRQSSAPMPPPCVPPASPVIVRRERCATPGCRMPLPAGARFCPRCGVQAAAPLDRVA